MDRVRFGRALGFGARQAAKTLVKAMDAATAENPQAGGAAATAGGRGPRASAAGSVQNLSRANADGAERPADEARTPTASRAARIPSNAGVKGAARTTGTKGVKQGLKLGGRRAAGSFARLSGVLWLEVSGVFFGVFALSGLVWGLRLWVNRHVTAANTAEHVRLEWMAAGAVVVVFGYFCASNFVRARRRERGR